MRMEWRTSSDRAGARLLLRNETVRSLVQDGGGDRLYVAARAQVVVNMWVRPEDKNPCERLHRPGMNACAGVAIE
jgi:hypothetical protein